ncbi:PNGase F N-terminal domain-containing protein [Aureibaculum sp. 2210JD6-5]|uniref:PNGase F N-terminal domain-containing protein n=1 Tax=Aureibaculum sp. 2210JD6-5 TaxID=3103957 RepID=UPI002AAD29F5|nr:PNGase F N-terminal domain-containing protein [Aureibaculum sp. 2210JD6-5]MDY7395136.1 PNGase F N-terminal domain-containing protein [Aureibaculum sp. 2210JD6-5]
MKKIIYTLLLIIPIIAYTQKNPVSYNIKYDNISNGKKSDRKTTITYQNQIVFLSESDDKIQQFTDYKTNEIVSTTEYNDKLFKEVTPFDSLPKPIFEDKPETILGYKCKYAKYSYFSNTIEMWFTEKATIKGSPSPTFLPSKNALVLKIIINGNRILLASSIEKNKKAAPRKYLADEAQEVTTPEFEEIKINSRFIKVPIFDNEIVNFDPSIEVPDANSLEIDKMYRLSKGSVIMKKIKLTPELKNSGNIFVKLQCRSNGDAYDRTGSVFIIPVDENISVMDAYLKGLDQLPIYTDNTGEKYQGIIKSENYKPPVEIMRFFTSFGADYFNDKRVINNYDWAEDVRYKQEITPLIPNNVDEIWVGVFIGNYDKGGHKVSLELDFYPSFRVDETKTSKYIEPLFSTVNTLEMSGQNYGRLFKTDTLTVHFEIPKNIEDLQLLFTTTGHGGWGRGDEFVPKMNKIFIDGKEVFKIVPWRTDCATYRFSNPASGNFGNGLSSSDLSRSNWCPGTPTPPYYIPLTALKPGKHTIQVVIDQGEDEGSSFSHWSVTGVLTGTLSLDE